MEVIDKLNVDIKNKLMKLAHTVQQDFAMKKLLEYRNQFRADSNPRFWAVVDFSRPSFEKRLFVFDAVQNNVQAYYVAHGRGSEGKTDDGYAEVFSNVPNSNCSSLGIYLCSESYQGSHGYSMRLDGLEPSNSKARERLIVIHSADYVSEDFKKKTGRMGRSEGCFVVEKAVHQMLIDQLKGGSLLMAWNP